MQQTPRSLINELIACYETKHEAESKIEEAKKFYYETLYDNESVINRENKKIQKIEDYIINFSLENFVKELQLTCYGKLNENEAELYTSKINSGVKPLSLKELIKVYKYNEKDGNELEINFNIPHLGQIGISMPLTIISLDAEQKDGRKLIECLHIKHEKDENGDFVNYLTCDDWRNIIFNVPLRNLLINGKLYYDGMAALKAHERDFGSEANV